MDYMHEYFKIVSQLSVIYEKKYSHNEIIVDARHLKSEVFVLEKT